MNKITKDLLNKKAQNLTYIENTLENNQNI